VAEEEPTSPSKRKMAAAAAAERESIERIKARAIANGTMRADPELVVRHVDPATLRPPEKEKPVQPHASSESLRGRPARPIEEAAMDAAGLPDEPRPGNGGYAAPKREKDCRRCGEPFVPRSGNQRYCDRDECRTKPCQRDGCDKRFEIKSERPGQKFCSQECSQLALRGDSNPEQEPEALPGAPGPRGPSSGPDSPDREEEAHSRAESPPEPPPGDELGDQDPSSAGSSAAPAVPRDSSQEPAEGSGERYVELLYGLVEGKIDAPDELRAQALEQLHELWKTLPEAKRP